MKCGPAITRLGAFAVSLSLACIGNTVGGCLEVGTCGDLCYGPGSTEGTGATDGTMGTGATAAGGGTAGTGAAGGTTSIPPCSTFSDCTGPAGECKMWDCVDGQCKEVPVQNQPEQTCGEQSCTKAVVMLAGTCADGVCQQPTEPCAPYACDDATNGCKTACAGDADCLNAYCKGTECAEKEQPGTVCSGSNMCANDYCVDDRCCKTSCADPCYSCNLGANPGTCTAVPKGIVDACADGKACNGSGACETPLGTRKVVGQPCVSDIECFNGECVAGLCRLPDGTACEPSYDIECERNLCKDGTCQQCQNHSDCPSNNCSPTSKGCKFPAGHACGVNVDCVSNNCVNNVCQ